MPEHRLQKTRESYQPGDAPRIQELTKNWQPAPQRRDFSLWRDGRFLERPEEKTDAPLP